jgi:hypothetical protein
MSGLTAFPKTEAFLRWMLADAPLDVASLARPIRRCRLEDCKGMCCYDGIYLDDEEARVLVKLARDEADFFRDLGLNLPAEVVVDGNWEGLVSGPKTAVAPWPAAEGVPGFPPHFHATACVFHLPDGRCGLQVLSTARGRHPWYFKPTGCWLHPLSTDDGDGLRLHDADSDSCRAPGYPGFIAWTRCGATDEQGQAAHEVLREELEFLGRIVRRDLAAEASGRRVALDVVEDNGT